MKVVNQAILQEISGHFLTSELMLVIPSCVIISAMPPKNAQYQSPSIQNDIITCCGEWIQKSLIRELVQIQYFAICADEAADSSSKEQLPLVVRFVDDTCIIREEFLEFIVCDEVFQGLLCPKKYWRRYVGMD